MASQPPVPEVPGTAPVDVPVPTPVDPTPPTPSDPVVPTPSDIPTTGDATVTQA
jgi:hypothetical protein